jgi:glycine cleavage system transcriptional repressor
MNGKNQLVVMALGPDRVGLVAQVTGFIRERGGNVEDSRMAVLGSEFGVMVLVSGSEEQLARLESEVAKLTDAGMDVLVRRTTPLEEDRTRQRAVVVAEALDHEGIVHSLSAAIERLGVSIASLETACYPAPLSGGPLFRLEAVLELPTALDLDGVRKGLVDVADTENLDLEIRMLEPR